MKFILAKKLGMTTIYNDGVAQNVTLLEVGKNVVTQVKTADKDGYAAVQIGWLDEKKADKKKVVNAHEFCVEKVEDYKLNDEIKVDQFSTEDKVNVIGISKGKGYQGVVKRHNFSGSPSTHGHRHDHRAPGSIGCAFPERVFPGKRMAGRMGSDQVTAKNLKVALVDAEKNLLALEGAVPGNNGSIVQVVKRD